MYLSLRIRIISYLIVGTALFLFACEQKRDKVNLEQPAAVKADQAADSKPVLHVAVAAMISPETTSIYYEELMKLIAEKIGRRAVFSQRKTYAEVNELVRKKEVDLAFVCSGPYTQGKKEFGMELLAVPVSNGKTVYHSYIIVNRTSPISSMKDLRDRKFAFTDPQSNTGCLVPTYMLSRMGETPKSFFSDYFYTNSHDNSIKAVASNQTDGAAVDSLIWEFMNKIDPALTSRTKIIEKSPPYGIPPIVVNPALDPETKKRLKNILLTLHEDRKAAPLLEKIQIDRFVEGNDKNYDTVRSMGNWLEKKTGN
jgi:phosphate/phosphite/phosphonate ABC transporter binding protein